MTNFANGQNLTIMAQHNPENRYDSSLVTLSNHQQALKKGTTVCHIEII